MTRPPSNEPLLNFPGYLSTAPRVGATLLTGCIGITLLVVGILICLHVIQSTPTAMYALVGLGGGILLVDVLVALSIQYCDRNRPADLPPQLEEIVELETPPHPQEILTPSQSNLREISLLRCGDAIVYIFSFLDLKELCKTATTCHTFATCIFQIHFSNAAEVKRWIEYYINLAEQLDPQIVTLTKGLHHLIGNNIDHNLRLFKFPLDQWRACVDNSRSVHLSCNGMTLLNRCRLDLVEALAEFNIDAKCFESENVLYEMTEVTPHDERLIARMTLPEKSIEAENILESAKSTLKGVCRIVNCCTAANPPSFFSSNWKENKVGYLLLSGNNLENRHWSYPIYKRAHGYKYISIEQWIGLCEGDRFVILPEEASGESIMMRCKQRWTWISIDKILGDFEQRLIFSMIRNADTDSSYGQDITPHKQALRRAQAIYGTECMRLAFGRYCQLYPRDEVYVLLSELATFLDPPISLAEIK